MVPELWKVNETSLTEVARPIQLNCETLYWTPDVPSASSIATVWLTMPSAVPSRGARAYR